MSTSKTSSDAFRALCAELTDALDSELDLFETRHSALLDRARAALAEPDPVAELVASQVPMPDEMRDALSAPGALWDMYEEAALAEEAGAGPTDEGLDDWLQNHPEVGLPEAETHNVAYLPIGEAEMRAVIRDALARWGPTHPRPIPVAERPWEREGFCDARGLCWWTVGTGEVWTLCRPSARATYGWMLPAAAIPLPQQENKND
jgi:hypothetical protein